MHACGHDGHMAMVLGAAAGATYEAGPRSPNPPSAWLSILTLLGYVLPHGVVELPAAILAATTAVPLARRCDNVFGADGRLAGARRRISACNIEIPQRAVIEAMREARVGQHGVPLVPQGGNSGMSGGATPDASGHALVGHALAHRS